MVTRTRESSDSGTQVVAGVGLALLVLVGLGVCLLVVRVLTGDSSAMSRGELDRSLARMTQSHREAFYLGNEADGQHLAVIRRQAGVLYFNYGECLDDDEGGCTRPLNVTSQPPDTWRNGGYVPGVPCRRRPSILGVPAADIMGSLTVFTGSSMVSVTYFRVTPKGYVSDERRETSVVPQLRAVGESGAAEALPPPDAETRAFVDQHCGLKPGDSSRLP
jgi:hypothetical protein